jgi:prophage maintenance system killer protein
MLSKKDIIAMNAEFDQGRVVNESSLDYAIAITHRSKNWLKSAALLVRAILIDHVFQDGNKRTAAGVIMVYLDFQGFHFDPKKVDEAVVRILEENITDIRKIERNIKHAIN